MLMRPERAKVFDVYNSPYRALYNVRILPKALPWAMDIHWACNPL